MKKIILTIVLSVICIFSNAQVLELNGCMGINFGDSQQQVKQMILSKKAGFELYRDESDVVSYIDGTFAGRKCVGAIFMFYQNKLHTIKILLLEEQSPRIMDLYYTVVSELKEKYQVPVNQQHNFRSPYYEGDGYTVSAVKLGYADINSYLNFADGNVIDVEITKNMSVMLTYQSSSLAQQAIDNNTQKRSKDY